MRACPQTTCVDVAELMRQCMQAFPCKICNPLQPHLAVPEAIAPVVGPLDSGCMAEYNAMGRPHLREHPRTHACLARRLQRFSSFPKHAYKQTINTPCPSWLMGVASLATLQVRAPIAPHITSTCASRLSPIRAPKRKRIARAQPGPCF